jgi:hypothetical protein
MLFFGRDVHRAHGEREGRHDQDDPAAGPDQPRHAPQRPDVVFDVFQHVVRHRTRVCVHLLGGQQHLPDGYRFMPAEPLFERHQAVGIGFRRGEAAEVRLPRQRVVAQAAADLDRVITQERQGQFYEPAAVVHGRREALEDLGLHALISVYSRHLRLQSRPMCGNLKTECYRLGDCPTLGNLGQQ